MRQWYEKVAAQGDASAQHTLGLLYANGRGGSQDYVQARQWYENPQHRGMPTASFFSGYCICKGKEFPAITRRPCYGFVWPQIKGCMTLSIFLGSPTKTE
jgi:TPR repeat protein